MARTDPRPNYGSKVRTRRDGYVDIYEPTHPLARSDGYLFEHRKVAWDNGLLTDPSLEVHHRNEMRADNSLSNLEVKDGSTHALDHAEERGWVTNQFGTWPVKPRDMRTSAPRPVRICINCGTRFSHERRRDAAACSQKCNMAAWKYRRKHGGRNRYDNIPAGFDTDSIGGAGLGRIGSM